jgi:hypothetical protein
MSAYRYRRYAFLALGPLVVGGLLAVGNSFAAAQGEESEEDSRETSSPRVKIRIDPVRTGVEVSVNGERIKDADYVRFGEGVFVAEDETILGDVVAIGGDIEVEGQIDGDCVAIGGDLDLGSNAVVDGDVVCIGGVLTLGDSAQVGGSAVSVWGELDASPTAYVAGERTEVHGGGVRLPFWLIGFDGGRSFRSDLWGFFSRLVWVFVLVGIGILAYSIFPSRMARLADVVNQNGLVTFLAGLAGWVLWLPVFVLLCITIVGIPVAILLIFLTPIMVLLGYLGVAIAAGRKSEAGRAGGARAILLGVLMLEAGLLLGKLFGTMPSIFEVLGVILTIVGCIVIFIAATMGFGAFLMTRFRAQEQKPPVPGAAA